MRLNDDRDIKIVPNDPSQIFDSAEGAAYAFKRESENGNMEKAKHLGMILANELLDRAAGAAYFGAGGEEREEIQYQRPILFAFIVNTVLADFAPNSIVAHSALSTFYDMVGKSSPDLHTCINDPVAYSQYIHCARAHPNDQRALGHVFARLCGQQNDAVIQQMGHALAHYFSGFCETRVLQANWIR